MKNLEWQHRSSQFCACSRICLALCFLSGTGTAFAQNSPAVITVHSAVQAANPVAFGFNSLEMSSQANVGDNHWVADGGFAPLQNSMSLTAESGTATTFVDVNQNGGTDFFNSLYTGFFNEATAYTYRYSGGAWTLLRTDTIANYTAVGGSTNPADHTITFAQSGPVVQQGDVIWMEQSPLCSGAVPILAPPPNVSGR